MPPLTSRFHTDSQELGDLIQFRPPHGELARRGLRSKQCHVIIEFSPGATDLAERELTGEKPILTQK